MFRRTAPAAHLPLSPPTPNQCSSAHTHFFQFQFSALVLQGPRMGAGRRPEQIFPSLHPRLRRSPMPFFFPAPFFFLSFSLFLAFFCLLSICLSLFAHHLPHLAQPSLRIFPHFPHGASRHLGSTATKKLVRIRKKSLNRRKKPVWPNPATHRRRVKPSLGFRALNSVTALCLPANLDRPILPSLLQSRKTAHPAPL